jgi:hypothetical protein
LSKQDYDQPELYHLVINTARVPLEDAERLVVQMVNPEA